MVRLRSVALITRNPVLYSELAGFLRERRLPSVSLLPGQRIPDRVVVVLTSREEAPEIAHPNVLAVSEDGDHRALAAAVEHALGASGSGEGELVVGIDPGPRPGYAILSGDRCLGEGVLESPEAAGPFASHLRHQFPHRRVVFRVGSGDPPRRNRLVNELLLHHRWVELVDEQGTTPRGRRRSRDPAAARSIARGLGRPVTERLPTTFTPGEISNLQRLSREGSDGRVTISRSSADAVLRGEISLADAVAATLGQSGRGTPTPPSARRERL
jgi:hypothetical protein